MKAHAGEWISAYYDGELYGARLAWVEYHLSRCEACRTELEQLRRLSAVLQSVPTLADQAIPDRSTPQPRLRLSPAGRTVWQKGLKTGWQAVPFGLVLAWSFFQAVLLASALVMSSGFGKLFPALTLPGFAFWEALTDMAGVAWINPFNAFIPWLGLGESFFHLIYLNLALTLATGVFLWGWLASWWVYRTRSKPWITLEF